MKSLCHSVAHLAFFVLLLAVAAVSSPGDQSYEYQKCVSLLVTKGCGDLPFSLWLTRWTCTDDSKYRCMHMITNEAVDTGEGIYQYHGKWPFWRFAGMQEPASVAFSLLNLWFHVRGARQVRRKVPSGHPMRQYYLVWAIVSINAWIWSSVFHTRDLPTTEKLDYFSAALAILYALYFTVLRLFHIYPSFGTRNRSSSAYRLWTFACAITYLAHISYLTLLPRFDYTYNIIFNLVLGLIHNALWLVYSFPSSFSPLRRFPARPKSFRPAFANKAALFVLLTIAATALELFDFPPWSRIIDAHSLWHLSTAFIIPLWYNFLIEDALDDGWKGHKVQMS